MSHAVWKHAKRSSLQPNPHAAPESPSAATVHAGSSGGLPPLSAAVLERHGRGTIGLPPVAPLIPQVGRSSPLKLSAHVSFVPFVEAKGCIKPPRKFLRQTTGLSSPGSMRSLMIVDISTF